MKRLKEVKRNDILYALGFIVACQLAGIIGSLFTYEAIPTWYATLNRPGIAPPNYVFAPVWTTLYTLMGIAAYLVWKKGWKKKEVKTALYTFGAQLALNTVWSIIFFGWKDLLLALAEILVLWAAIFVTIQQFWKLDKRAAYMMMPYLLWVSFATILNYSFWVLN